MWKAIIGAAVLAISGCDVPNEFTLLAKPPTTWTEVDDETYKQMVRREGFRPAFLSFCRNYKSGKGGAIALSQADFVEYETVFRQLGLTRRDIDLIRSRSSAYGIGQTYNGLACSMGYDPRVNKSFYQGLGHQWQAILPGQFVYLRGNGELNGMTVHAWN